jgi:hypothetical protein
VPVLVAWLVEVGLVSGYQAGHQAHCPGLLGATRQIRELGPQQRVVVVTEARECFAQAWTAWEAAQHQVC